MREAGAARSAAPAPLRPFRRTDQGDAAKRTACRQPIVTIVIG
jgi:hypothetical protein